jgi:hypothetical protein
MSSSYPLNSEMVYARPVARRRVTVVFRAVLVIPQLVVLYFVSLAALAVLVTGWFAVLLAGRWPRGLQSFVVGWMRAVGVFSAITGIQSAWAAIVLGWLVGLAMRRSRCDVPTTFAAAGIALAGSALASLIAVTLRIVKEAHVPLTAVLGHMPEVAPAVPRDIGWFGFACWALATYLGWVTVSRGEARPGPALPPATPSGQPWPDAESR